MAKRKKNKHLPPKVHLKFGAYYYVELVDGKRKWHRLGTTLEEALGAYARRHSFNLQLMSDVFRRYAKEILPQKAESTQRKESQYLARLDTFFGDAAPDIVKPIHIYQYLDIRGAGARVTANRELSVLSDCFKKAIRWGVLEENPCNAVERNRERPRERYVSDAEFWAVWELAPPVVKVAMELALMLGLRPGDLLKLSRQNLRDDGILVRQSKTGKALLFEWSDELREAVERAKRIRKVASFWLLPNQKSQHYTVDGFRQLWRRVMADYERQGGTRFQFRDLRAKSGSDHESGEHLGHGDRRVLERVYKRRPRRVKSLKIAVDVDAST